jgi:hypothetical protein
VKLIPRIHFINYLKCYPQSAGCWKQWFSVRRYWGGKIILISVRHFAIEFDFRRDWLADMVTGNTDGDTKKALEILRHGASTKDTP